MKGLYFEKDESASAAPEEGEESKEPKKPEWTPEQQAELDKRAAAIKKAALDEGRKKALAEFEAKQSADKEAAEKARLAEEGKYKEMSEKAESEKKAAEERAAAAERKARTLELKDTFRTVVKSLDLEFVNQQAEKDAFSALNADDAIEGETEMKAAVESLLKERPFLFASGSDEIAGTDAREKGKRQVNQKTKQERTDELVQRFNMRKPR